MADTSGPRTAAITEDDAAIAAALEQASVPCLVMSMVHMSGDTSILDSELRPLGVFINEFQGYMSEQAKAEIRSKALGVIKKFRDEGAVLPPPPDEATVHKMMSYLVGQPVPSEYVPMMLEELELDGKDQRTDTWSELEVPRNAREDFHVVVIGGGVSGVLAAIRLSEAGIPFTVIEKNESLGGTWFENRYPGARVDVANHLYCYSFEPAHHWTKFFSQQPELQRYFENCVEKYSLHEHFRFRTEVTSARYDDNEKLWHTTIQTSDGEPAELVSRVVISAVGQLNRPRVPDIPGRQDFCGPTMHSAAWDPAIDVTGKRVAVVGSGASAFQLVPELAKTARTVTVFQRTANWMFENPHYHDDVSAGKKWCLQHLPFYARWFRFLIFWPALDGAYEFAVVDPKWPHQERSINAGNDGIREMFTTHIKQQVGDNGELLEKVLPDHAPMGKRVLQDNGSWLAALQQPNVQLIDEAVTRIDSTGVTSESGERSESDIIVFATGFHTNRFLWPMRITGAGGVALSDQWGEEPSAYLGITVPNFPNLFLCYGPGTNLAFGGSIIFNIECQVRYIMDCIKLMLQSGSQEMACKPDVHAEYYRRFREQHARMVWEHASIKHSFYTNDDGLCTLLWPWKIITLWERTKSVDRTDYQLS